MNSSGIKRGLATTAVSALAIAGLPLFASAPANAANGDVLTTAYAGPALDGDTGGAVVVLKSKNIAEADVNTAGDLKVIAQSLNAPANNANQTIGAVEFVSFTADDATNEFGGLDGFDEIAVRIPVDTRNIGDTASFAVFLDDDQAGANNGTVQSSEPTTNVSVTTAGPVAQIQISPNSQTQPAGVQSSPYTITLKDAGGRTTQLADGTTAVIEGDGATIAPANNGDADTETISSDQLARGTFNFRATGPAVDVYDMTVTAGAVVGRATLDVVESAAIDADELNIVTAADNWFSPTENQGFGATTDLAPTQSSLVFNFQSDNVAADRNDFVTVTFSSAGVTFGGASSVTKSLRLDNNGAGSFTVDVDPASIQTGDTITVAGTINLTLRYTAANVQAIRPAQAAYVAAPRSSTTVTATLVDTYRNPISSGQLRATITAGPNTGDVSPRVNVDANGQASFTFTDDSAVPGQSDTVTIEYFENNFDPSGSALAGGNTTQIRYTADGQGSDFTTRLNNVTASGAGYDPASVSVIPLTDANATAIVTDEYIDLDVVNAESNSPITISVDNGALILQPGETTLAQGSATVTDTAGTGTITGRTAGTSPGGYAIVGTKTGVVNVTVTAAGRTETSQFTVAQDPTVVAPSTTARNLAVDGPDAGVAGDVVTFEATITDAFGNPVAGFNRVGGLNVTVSGPGALQDGSAVSDANGKIALNVRLSDGADSPVTVSVTATGAQFGAAANQETTLTAANGAPGLPASVNSASATTEVTDLAGLERAVEEAEEALAEAQQALAAAQGNLDVAQTELAVAQANVDTLQAKVAKLKRKLDRADTRKEKRSIRKKLRAARADLRDAKDAVTIATAKVAAAQTVVDNRTEDVADAQADLDEAEQNLEDAQS